MHNNVHREKRKRNGGMRTVKKIKFDNTFEFGVATASYQIEGAWNEEGKGESIWDRFTHIPGNIEDGTNGDTACDFYHRYKEDIETASNLGFQVFRFSVSWSRIFPEGFGAVNQKGIEFYRSVIEEIKKRGMKASLTIFHWDLPQKLQDKGGWANRDIVGWFEEYSRVLFEEYGDLVDYWITLNEPVNPSILGYWTGEHAPGYHDYSMALTAAHNLLLCHGTAVKLYRSMRLTGEIGITLNMNKAYPADPDNVEDIKSAGLLQMQINNLYGDPVWLGSYPKEFMDHVAARGVTLPEIQEGDMELIHQPLDFFGLNNYFADIVTSDSNDWPLGVKTVRSGKPLTAADWEVWPEGFYDLLIWINERYHPPKIIITENGAAINDWIDSQGNVVDTNRIEYFKGYLEAVSKAMNDGAPVTGYYVWSLLDNFEWAWGEKRRFGIVYIDYKTKKRTVKESALWFSKLIESKEYEM